MDYDFRNSFAQFGVQFLKDCGVMEPNPKACARKRLALQSLGRFLVLGFLVFGLSAAQAQSEGPTSQPTQNPPDKEEAKPSPDQPPPRELAPNIVDDLRGRVNDRAPIPPWYQNNPTEEAKAYCQALIAANETSAQAFANSARHDVTFAHLFEEPEKYRGQVVHFEGRLVRLRRFDPPAEVRGDTFGINNLYEGWIFDPEIHGANPVCIVFTQLPPGVSVKEALNIPVAFDAYFFKRYRYETQEKDSKGKNIVRDCPLFIGHTLQMKKVKAATADHAITLFTKNLVIAVLVMFLATVGLVIVLSWWYRRGDRRLHTMLTSANAPVFPEPEAPVREPSDAWPPDNGSANGTGHSEYPDTGNRLRHGNMER